MVAAMGARGAAGPDFSNLVDIDIGCSAVLQGHSAAVLCCNVDASGATIASGSEDGELKL